MDDYIRRYRDPAQRARQFFKDCSLQQAIGFAALCKLPGGKRHAHQYRLPRVVLAEAESNLQEAAAEIRGCQTFADLHDLVRHEIGRIAGIGRPISRSELPDTFRRLCCCEAEDCLCMHKADLARIASRT